MKKIILLFALFLFFSHFSYAQNLSLKVYDLMQEKCMDCHSNANQLGNLDLEGIGSTAAIQVYNNIVGKTPTNAAAAAIGDQLIYPGRPDKSFLFRKINNGLEPTITHDTNTEGGTMPASPNAPLTNEEIELVRQWILLGAPATDNQTDIPSGYFSELETCLLYTSPSPRDQRGSRMPSSA